MAKKPGFEERMQELEKIVDDLERGELTLEDSVEHYRKGVKIHLDLKTHLAKMEKKIEELTSDGRQAFDPGGDEGDALE